MNLLLLVNGNMKLKILIQVVGIFILKFDESQQYVHINNWIR